ncbi:MAG: hypothetical protein R3B36_31925 [Polyangiaceae bacterium]
MSRPDGGESEARRRRLEAVALGLLAALPVLPYLAFVLRTGVPRFSLFGDFALLEHATRHVWTGETLLGPYSRFRWNHPGPLFFYVAAPFTSAFGAASTGLYVATCVVNAAAAATIAACARMFAERAHAAAAVVGVLAWFVAFGNVAANPWNPLLVVLPLMAFLVAAAMFARGASGAVYPAIVWGALVAQMHVAAISTVAAAGVLSLGAFVVTTRRRARTAAPDEPWLSSDLRRRLVIAAAVLLVLFLPPLVEQITSSTGNFTKIWRFFVHREEPLMRVATALEHWSTATSWLPDRVMNRSLLDEGYIPLAMRWDPVPEGVTKTARTIALLHVVLVTAAAAVAWRRRDRASLALLAFGALADLVAVNALQAVIGTSYHYLVFWTTGASTVAWIGVLSAFFSAGAAAATRSERATRLLSPATIAIGLALGLATTSLQRQWLSTHPVAPASRPAEREALRDAYTALRERLDKDGATAVIHADGAWDMAHATVLELEKDRVDVRVSEADRWNYYGVRSSDGLAKPLHVYFSTTPLPLAQAGCLELIVRSADISIFGAPAPVPSCPKP